VILGGLISSTLLDFFVHPARFWLFGRKQAEQQFHEHLEEDQLEMKPPMQTAKETPIEA
jgi:HME family heavy-metal exporter